MAIINFPTGPNVGDTYTFEGRTWRWNGNGWTSMMGFIVVSASPPASPQSGWFWYDTDSGNCFIYVYDGNTSQWVDISAGSNGIFPSNSLLRDAADQSITGGGRIVPLDLGNSGTGTITPDPGDRPIQMYTNTGAHTLAPGTNYGSYVLDIINSATAGAITTSGWTKVVGDTFVTTNGYKFRCSASITANGSLLQVQAMQ